MARVAIFGKRIPDEVQTFVERTIDSLIQEGCDLVMYRGFQHRINEQWSVGWAFPEFKNAQELQACAPDFLLVIGGDGTILDATTLVERSDIPIIWLEYWTTWIPCQHHPRRSADGLEGDFGWRLYAR